MQITVIAVGSQRSHPRPRRFLRDFLERRNHVGVVAKARQVQASDGLQMANGGFDSLVQQVLAVLTAGRH